MALTVPQHKAKETEAILYLLMLYLIHHTESPQGRNIIQIVEELRRNFEHNHVRKQTARDERRLRILEEALKSEILPGDTVLKELFRDPSGMTAGIFLNTKGSIFVLFRGTGGGEWIDNGEGLSGIAEENTYLDFSEGEARFHTVKKDHASDQQVQAWNWFRGMVHKNRWMQGGPIIAAGHSKGGNKAQFITMNTDLVSLCLSFSGQGFSPEAIRCMKNNLGADFDKRRRKIHNFSAENDYVNVLGIPLMPDENTHYFRSFGGIHHPEAILRYNGEFREECAQGELSSLIQKISQRLMDLPPLIRGYAVLGVMNVFQKYFGKGEPVNGDNVSLEKTITGIAVALAAVLSSFGGM